MLIIIAVAIAGCSGTTPTAPTTGGTPAPTTAAGALAGTTSAPSGGSVVGGANIFGSNPASYNWWEYKTSSGGNTIYIKYEKSGKCTFRIEGAGLPSGGMTQDCSSNGQYNKRNPMDIPDDYKFTFVSIEPVSVGAGTYPAATKYLITAEGRNMYYWTAPSVPLFVKLTIPTKDGSEVVELNGWG
jgi:hypothetical protein